MKNKFTTKNINFHLTRKKKYFLMATIALALIIIAGQAIRQTTSEVISVNASHPSAEEEPAPINPAYQTSQTYKILVIEINPHLNTVEGKPKVGDYMFGEKAAENAVDELVSDLEWASNGYLNIETKWEYMDTFPRYQKSFILPDGTTGYAFDEANFLDASGHVGGEQAWWNLYLGCWLAGDDNGNVDSCEPGGNGVRAVKAPASYSFDYDWLIDEQDLVNRKNNGEFDHVWLVSMVPSQTDESMMVGKNTYYINGTERRRNCDNFMIGGASMDRRDGQLHALGHAMENIMDNVYGMRYHAYSKDIINISTKEEYLALNPWERFMLNDYANAGTLNGVGTVHHPFTADSGYNYDNENFVNTTYLEWKNKSLEDMTGDYTSANHTVWDSAPYNDGGPNLTSGRYYVRLWFSLFPRDTGYTEDGYLKNWWKYFSSMDFVTSISAQNGTEYEVGKGWDISLPYTLSFKSGNTETGEITTMDNSIKISNTDVVNIVDGKPKALNYGESKITMYRDGKSIEYSITVSPNIQGKQEVSFESSSVSKIYGDASFTNAATTTGDGAITYSSSNNDVATVDSNTGEVKIKGAGVAIITANAAATDYYNAASASYTVNVSKRTSAKPIELFDTKHGYVTEKLSTISFETEGLIWDDKDAEIKEGTNSYAVKYTENGDSNNYTTESFEMTIVGVYREYEVVKGDEQIYTIGADDFIVFEINADYSLFEEGGEVYINEVLLSKEDYVSESGSTIIKIKNEYVETLDEGDYTLTVHFNNKGTATANFSLKEEDVVVPNTSVDVPDTGSNMVDENNCTSTSVYLLPITVLLVMGAIFTKNNKKTHVKFDN